MLGVSEIGLPVNDVRATVRHIEHGLREAAWDRKGDRFAAVGDERGLFIVVPTSHTWYPTTHKVDMWPLFVMIEGDVDARFSIPELPYYFAKAKS